MDPTYHGFGAPVPTKNYSRGGLQRNMLLLIIGGIVAVIIAGFLLISSQDKSGPLQTRLSARLDALQKIAAEGTKNAKDPGLRELNSRISIQVLSDTTSIDAALKSAGAKKPDKSVTTDEADTASFTTLHEAALNNRFDSAYKKLIAQKLDSTNALVKELFDTTGNKNLRSVLNDTYGHFKQLQDQLAATSS
jgi:hypothetical protein